MGLFNSGKQNRGKMRSRISKLENQVEAVLRKENQGPMVPDTTIDILPEQQMNQGLNPIGNEEDGLDLSNSLPPIGTISSPFQPDAWQTGQEMFGKPVPGSFDRSMDEEEEIY